MNLNIQITPANFMIFPWLFCANGSVVVKVCSNTEAARFISCLYVKADKMIYTTFKFLSSHYAYYYMMNQVVYCHSY